MSLILCYCEKCGQHYDISDKRISGLEKVVCTGCCETGYFKPVPEEYLNDGGWGINKSLEEEFIEKIIKSSPNFDQVCWDRRVDYQETRRHYDEILRNKTQERKNVPKCPSCGSSNISKIGVLNRAVSTGFLGLASSKIGKTHKCNNCGTMW